MCRAKDGETQSQAADEGAESCATNASVARGKRRGRGSLMENMAVLQGRSDCGRIRSRQTYDL